MDIVSIDFNHTLIVKLEQGEVALSLRKNVNNSVSFGIEAPKAVPVNREEIHLLKIQNLQK